VQGVLPALAPQLLVVDRSADTLVTDATPATDAEAMRAAPSDDIPVPVRMMETAGTEGLPLTEVWRGRSALRD
jgi:hypothetical protein